MAQTIKIKRSVTSNVPSSNLAEGELAYGHSGDDAGKLVIGRPLASGESATNDVIGGKFFVDQISNAVSTNTASRLVKRDESGDFSAGTITASLTGDVTGNVTGNVSGSSGSCTGNAATATALASDITINSNALNGGDSLTLNTDDISEGSTNEYFTSARSYNATKTQLDHSSHSNVTFTFNDAQKRIDVSASAQYSDSDARGALTGATAGSGSGDFSYNQTTGVMTYTKVTNNEIREAAETLNQLEINSFDGTTFNAGNIKFGASAASPNASQVDITAGGSTHPFAIKTFIKDDEEGTTANILSSDRHGDDDDLFVGVNFDATSIPTANYANLKTMIGGGLFVDGASRIQGSLTTKGNHVISGTTTSSTSLIFQTGDLTGAIAQFTLRHDPSTGKLKIKDQVTDVVTIPHSDNATGSTAFQIHRDTEITGDLEVSGDLTVNGGTTTITSTELAVGDAIITLNDDLTTSATSEDAGIEVNRGLIINDPANTERAKAKFFFDESELEWKAQIPDSSNSASFTTQAILTENNVEGLDFTVDGGTFS
jgi:hypothetical protein